MHFNDNSIDKKKFEKSLKNREIILILGAGFSRDMKNIGGKYLPLGKELAKELWDTAFPDESFQDNDVDLPKIYELAFDESKENVHNLLKSLFTVNKETIPLNRFKSWFQYPWKKIYTFNIDTSTRHIAEGLEEEVQILSASRDSTRDIDPNRLSVVHIHGTLEDFPDITFSADDYMDRANGPDSWYEQFAEDVHNNPVLVVGTSLDEPLFWNNLKQYKDSQSPLHKHRIESWFVSPSITAVRRKSLEKASFKYISGTEKDFYIEFLKPIVIKPEELPSKALQESSLIYVKDKIEELVKERKAESYVKINRRKKKIHKNPDFLIGKGISTFLDVIPEYGYAVKLDSDSEIGHKIDNSGNNLSLIIEGAAGCGKTISLYRMSVYLTDQGERVFWLKNDLENGRLPRIDNIVDELLKLKADYVVIDNLDRFSDRGIYLIKKLKDNNIKSVCAMRTGRFRYLGYENDSNLYDVFTIPHISKEDAKNIAKALQDAKRLETLEILSEEERIRRIYEESGRELLVALLQATQGKKFKDIVRDEFMNLDAKKKFIYLMVSIAEKFKKVDLQQSDVSIFYDRYMGDSPHEGSFLIDSMVQDKILFKKKKNNNTIVIVPRHRVISEEVIDSLESQEKELLLDVHCTLIDLCFLKSLDVEKFYLSSYGNLLERLINHDEVSYLYNDILKGAKLYKNAESIDGLSDNPRFWVQRGNYEMTFNRYEYSENWLNTARTKYDIDPKKWGEKSHIDINTSLCHLKLRKIAGKVLNPETYTVEKGKDYIAQLYDLRRISLEPGAEKSPHTSYLYMEYSLKILESNVLDEIRWNEIKTSLKNHVLRAKYKYKHNSRIERIVKRCERYIETNPTLRK
jgi:protein containing tetratricopeptide repeat